MNRSAWLGFIVLMIATWCAANIAIAAEKTHEGMVVSAGAGKLVMTDTMGKEHTHVIANTVRITVNGKLGKLDDLKPGMRIHVTTDDQGTVMAVSTADEKK